VHLCLDVGNSHIYGGVFLKDALALGFRHDSKQSYSSDQFGLFLKHVLRENAIEPAAIKHIGICSVVPSVDYALQAACIKYFAIKPFILQAGVKTGLKVRYNNPLEVGADRIANAIAAVHLFPKSPLIIVDFGTATTCCAINAAGEYLGGAILPGMRLSMDALQQNTAKLFPVDISTPPQAIGKSTRESLQSGIYYAQLGTVKELIARFSQEFNSKDAPIILGTGGFATMFADEQLFTAIIPDLVLQGIRFAMHLNR